MWSRRVAPTEALDIIRRRKYPHQRAIYPVLNPVIEREQIWPNAGFQEQLALFEMCQYMPSQNEGIYTRWRQNLDRQIRERGLR